MLQETAVNLPLQLDRAASIPLHDQLFEQLRQLILTGRLKPNTRIIATRFLAEQVGVSRRTVLFAYERLIAEGYLETRPAVGTFVSPTPPDQKGARPTGQTAGDAQRQAQLHPSQFQAAAAAPSRLDGAGIDFSPSQIDGHRALPMKVWQRWIREIVSGDPDFMLKPVPAGGLDALRQVVADYLAATRGILASPEQLVIVNGRRHACSLVAHMFQHRGDRVVVEAPGDEDITGFFKARHAQVIGVPVDEHGLQTDALPPGPAALAFVTPSRQNPVGGVMPQVRRTALIEWARGAGAYIIEDDGDADLRYFGAALPPLVTTDPYGLTFHLGSFTRRLGSGLCLGYLLVPAEFAPTILSIKAMGAEGGQLLEQMVMANLIASGDYDHHLRRLRKVYLERRDVLIEALRSRFRDAQLIGTGSGIQLTWLLPDGGPSAAALCEASLARGVAVDCISGEEAGASPFRDKALILGYAALEPDVIRHGVAILGETYERLRTSG